MNKRCSPSTHSRVRIQADEPILRRNIPFAWREWRANIPAMSTERTARLSASPPLFKSRFLDFFSRIHPAVPALIYLPVIAALVVLGADDGQGARAIMRLTLGGLLLWTLTEYWLHRKLFHWDPDHPIGHRLHFIIHGVHHDHPNDRMRLVMPPGASIPLAALFFGLFWADLRAPDRLSDVRGLPDRISDLRLHALLPAPLRAEVEAGQARFANSTCATTSRITATASVSPRRSGTSSSAPCRAHSSRLTYCRRRARLVTLSNRPARVTTHSFHCDSQ